MRWRRITLICLFSLGQLSGPTLADGLSGPSSTAADLTPGDGLTDPQFRSEFPRNVLPGYFRWKDDLAKRGFRFGFDYLALGQTSDSDVGEGADQTVDVDKVRRVDLTGLKGPRAVRRTLRPEQVRQQRATIIESSTGDRQCAGIKTQILRCEIAKRMAVLNLERQTAVLRGLPRSKDAQHAGCSKPPFGGPEAVLAYLSRYTHRVAISNKPI